MEEKQSSNDYIIIESKNKCKKYFIITSLPIILIPSNILGIYYGYNNYYITLALIIFTTIGSIMGLFLPGYYQKLTINGHITEKCNKILSIYIGSFPIIILAFCLIIFWNHLPIINIFFSIGLLLITLKLINRKL